MRVALALHRAARTLADNDRKALEPEKKPV
jgi:hypothetical protein